MNAKSSSPTCEPVITLLEQEISTEQFGSAPSHSTEQMQDAASQANSQNAQNFQNN